MKKLKAKKLLIVLIVCAFIMGFLSISAGAVEAYSLDGQPIMRATRRLNLSIPANSLMLVDESISLDAGETLSYRCTYTPRSASVEFGYIGPDGLFYGLSGSNGSIYKGIRVSEPGSYTMAIWNQSDSAVTVTGTVKY